MSLEKAKAHLARFGREGDVMEFDVSSATVELAARTANMLSMTWIHLPTQTAISSSAFNQT